MGKKIFILIVFLLIIVTCGPLLTGFWVQHIYKSSIQSINDQKNLRIEIVDYHRHWFHSDATIKIRILSPQIRGLWQQLMQKKEVSAADIVVDQYIQHGPIVYDESRTIPLVLALASVQNSSYAGNKQYKVMFSNIFTFDENLLLQNLQFPYFLLYLPELNTRVEFVDGMQGKILVGLKKDFLNGQLKFAIINLTNEDNTLKVSNLSLQLNQYKSPMGLWLGQTQLNFPEISLWDADGKVGTLHNLNLDSQTKESANEFYAYENWNIEKLELDEQIYGPFHLKLFLEGIDAQALVDLIDAYMKILRTGEMYESQLQQKMMYLLPKIIKSGTHFKIQELQIDMPKGKLQLQGDIQWPEQKIYLPDDLMELIEVGKAHISMRVSKIFVDELIDYASSFSSFYNIPIEQKRQIIDTEADANEVVQQFVWTLTYLVKSGYLADNLAVQLLDMQKDNVSSEVFSQEIRELFLAKQMSLYVAYLLNWKYAQLQALIGSMVQQVDGWKQNQKQKMYSQLKLWTQKGLVVQDKEDYVLNANWDHGWKK